MRYRVFITFAPQVLVVVADNADDACAIAADTIGKVPSLTAEHATYAPAELPDEEAAEDGRVVHAVR